MNPPPNESDDSQQNSDSEELLPFSSFSFPESLNKALNDLEFVHCTPIQKESLPITLKGRDLAGKAQTGTGKTAAFLLTAIDHLLKNESESHVRTLILAPTRELAMQIHKDAENLTKYSDLNCVAVFGGMDYRKQLREMGGQVDILVATPGRLLDFMGQGEVDLRQLEILVIDEADRMLDMGFIPDVRRIVSRCPKPGQRQTLLFSATLNERILRLVSSWQIDPVQIEIEAENMVTDLVNQIFYSVMGKEKLHCLFYLLEKDNVERMLIFTNRKDTSVKVYKALALRGVESALLSGDIPQKKRIHVLEAFREGTTPVIVATDVAARGIHVDQVSHVVNFDLPFETEDYVHRIGRTGRAGESGKAISFADEYGSYIIEELEKYLDDEIKCIIPEDEILDYPLPAKLDPPPKLDLPRAARAAAVKVAAAVVLMAAVAVVLVAVEVVVVLVAGAVERHNLAVTFRFFYPQP